MTGFQRLAAFAKAAYTVAIEALDIAGSDGRISFQKWVLLLVLYVAALGDAPAVVLIAVIAASFGRSVFSLFLNRGSFNASASYQRQKITQEVDIDYVQRWRDGEPDEGVI